jgi:hypothetical protein
MRMLFDWLITGQVLPTNPAAAVHALPASEPDAVAGPSRKFLRKYQRSTHAHEMMRSEILPTTLRLEPR